MYYNGYDSMMLAVDCIIFGFDGKEIKALLVKRRLEPELGNWSLMGGFVNNSESIDAAANRILDQLTGLTSVYMEQLYCFGDVNRDPGARVVSIAYFALIKIDDYSEELMKKHHTKWFSLNKIPSLIFDHKQMIKIAKSSLQQKVSRQPIGFALLPDKFTLQQLQALYEAIYETVLDKRNFSKKILSLGVLEKLNEKDKETSKKGSFYYVFIREKYSKPENENFTFI